MSESRENPKIETGPDGCTDNERRENAEKYNLGFYVGQRESSGEIVWSIFDVKKDRPLGFRYFSWDEAMDRCKWMTGAFKAGRESLAEEIVENIKKMK